MRKIKLMPSGNSGGISQWLPLALLIAAALWIYHKFGGLAFGDSTRSEKATNESQDKILDNLAQTTEVSNKQRAVADNMFKIMNTQHVNGFTSAITSLFTDPSQKLLTIKETSALVEQFFSPNCHTLGDLKQTILAYGQRRHDNRESLLLGFAWDDHKYSLLQAVQNFVPQPAKSKLNKLLNDALEGKESTNIWFKNYM